MKAKTIFKKMYYKLPREARTNLVYHLSTEEDKFPEPYSLNVIWAEVQANTSLGRKFLEDLGFKDG